jgi:hypothetical protein
MDGEFHGVLPQLAFAQISVLNPAGYSRSHGEYGVTMVSAGDVAIPLPTVQEVSLPVAWEGETSRQAESRTSAIPIMIFPKSMERYSFLRKSAWVGDTPKRSRVSPAMILSWKSR